MGKKIIWAVDPFAKNTKALHRAFEVLKQIDKKAKVSIEPVYVFNFDVNTAVPVSLNLIWEKKARKEAEQALKKQLSGLKLKSLKAPKVLSKKPVSSRESVHILMNHAKRTGAELIVVTSHARRGPARWFLGSFAETLVLMSKVPVMLVNPDNKKVSKIDHFLFPTDFSSDSKKAYMRILKFAKLVNARVTLFHNVLTRFEPYFGTFRHIQGAPPKAYETLLNVEIDRLSKKVREWVAVAKKMKVKVDAKIERSNAMLVDSILQYEKANGFGMVAMASKKGPSGAILFGSISRQVARKAKHPAWVFHV